MIDYKTEWTLKRIQKKPDGTLALNLSWEIPIIASGAPVPDFRWLGSLSVFGQCDRWLRLIVYSSEDTVKKCLEDKTRGDLVTEVLNGFGFSMADDLADFEKFKRLNVRRGLNVVSEYRHEIWTPMQAKKELSHET